MNSDRLQQFFAEREEAKHDISNGHQFPRNSLARTSVYEPPISKEAWIPVQPQIKHPRELMDQLHPIQYSQAYDNGMATSAVNMELLVQQWLEGHTMYPLQTCSSIDVPGYTETIAGSTLSPQSEVDLTTPSTASTNYMQTYGSTTNVSPNSMHHISQIVSPNESIQPFPTSAAYFDTNSLGTTMSMLYPQATTTFDDYQTIMYATTIAPHIEPLQTITPSYSLHSVQEQYSVVPRGSADSGRYPLEVNEEHLLHHNDHLVDPKVSPSMPTTKHDLGTQEDMNTDHVKTISKLVSGPKRKTSKISKKIKEPSALMRLPKSELVSRQTSCWRCRRYKKPCNGKGSVCNACVTSGFRIWSTDIGCRKGDMNEFIIMLIPMKVESNPITIDVSYLKPRSFRQSSQMYPSDTLIPYSATRGDPWDQFLYKIQSTGIHGPGVLELLQIAIRHQRKFMKPDKAIVSAVRAMSAAADIFRLFVATEDSDTFSSTIDLNQVFTEARKILSAAAGHFLRNCLTGKMKSFFPTFMASNINVFAYILIGDAINAMPARYRAEIWPNVRKTLMDLRQVLYPTARDLMNALAKGSQPLNMTCWDMVQNSTVEAGCEFPKFVRNAEGMRLVDDCEATFDAMRELQEWRERFHI